MEKVHTSGKYSVWLFLICKYTVFSKVDLNVLSENDVEMILEFKKLCSYFGFQKCFLFSFFKGSSIPEI